VISRIMDPESALIFAGWYFAGLVDSCGGGEPDRGFRIENEAGAREGDAIRDAGAGLMRPIGVPGELPAKAIFEAR
jgi:hypothetical protein